MRSRASLLSSGGVCSQQPCPGQAAAVTPSSSGPERRRRKKQKWGMGNDHRHLRTGRARCADLVRIAHTFTSPCMDLFAALCPSRAPCRSSALALAPVQLNWLQNVVGHQSMAFPPAHRCRACSRRSKRVDCSQIVPPGSPTSPPKPHATAFKLQQRTLIAPGRLGGTACMAVNPRQCRRKRPSKT